MTRARVLVVDDEPGVLNAVRRLLSPDYDVAGVTSGTLALDRLRAESFGAILCDLLMPDMTGMELFARVAAENPEQAGRMLFITGGAFTAASRAFAETHADRLLEKPFDGEQLRARVAAVAQ